MSKLKAAERDLVVQMFSEGHLSCNVIAKTVGMSRGGIVKFLRKAGYDTSKSVGRHMKVVCLNCGKVVDVPTCHGRTKKYCSTRCYHEYIKDGEYRPWRAGQRIARAIAEPYIVRMYGKKQVYVMHHKDGDDENNEVCNLMAFRDQRDHLAYHRHHRIVSVLWDGGNM